ncbi:hypothetical protein N6O65_22050, partial [Escherichia coli]|nr:hypothetical protein [Escherichia coli]MDC6901353.1 hypothetical protein [Escherichia coli]MDC6905645.1 hypothetical protein [Escherichia coli]MDC6909952.1 hypothetical protein [Escherichia coli]MDC6914242.1 hypothetical protein [Escherichia coli]
SAQIREILISESAWEEMTCLFAPSLEVSKANIVVIIHIFIADYVIAGWSNAGESKYLDFPFLFCLRFCTLTGCCSRSD